MNWIDILIIVAALLPAFFGWRNGVIRWAITLVGAVIGVSVAGQAYTAFAPIFVFTDNETTQRLIAFAVIFFAILAAAWFVARLIKTLMKVLLLGWVDNVAGLALGGFVGLLGASAIITLLGILPSDSLKTTVAESSLAEPVVESTAFVRAFLPVEFDDIRDLFIDTAIEAIPGK
jgi:membrane protein required for colicin V production